MSTATATAPATPAAHTAGSAVMSHRQILLVIYGLMAGMFLSALDQTVVGTAIRTIGDDLHGLNEQAWVTTAYLIASTISTPIYGKLSDIFGRRPLYIFGITIFVLGSLAASFSTSMLMLAAFRGVQGIGAGALMSLPLAIMGDMLAPRERAKYQGYFLAVFGISSVIGPLVGGLFAGAPQILFITGWRWVFLINVPIGAVALAMVLAFLHLPRFGTRSVRIDWFGAAFVVMTLVPVLLVAEQGREWGWASVGSIACYVTAGVGLIAFLITETLMKDDAIIPLKLFRSRTFSMATVLGLLVGFGMFGALLTLPLYLQIVFGLSATQAGFATLPLMAGLMTAAIGSGQIIARTGKYRIFPIIGTGLMSAGFLFMTTVTADKPLWYLMIGMLLIGLGLGQLMQTLTMASQNSVQPRDMGVATSASTFFRQIGGTLGTAVLLSVLFSSMGGNIATATGNTANLKPALTAALTPSVAAAPNNRGIMQQLWTPIVTPIKKNVQSGLDTATAQVQSSVKAAVTKSVDAAVTKQVTAQITTGLTAQGVPAADQSAIVQQQLAAQSGTIATAEQKAIASALPGATTTALQSAATKAHASVVDGRLTVDWSNASQRSYWVDKVTPALAKTIKNRAGSSSSTSTSETSDTSFLNGADRRLSEPFLVGFNTSAVQIYWVGLLVVLAAFVLSLFFKVPPLRRVSALQEQADQAAGAATVAPAPSADHVDPIPGPAIHPARPATGAIAVANTQA